MDTSKRILETTIRLITTFGISSVTMDMIAHECGISKRTLYEKFSDKASLVLSALTLMQTTLNQELKQIFENADNVLEGLLLSFVTMRSYLNKTSPVFFSDVKRLYPMSYEKQKEYDEKRVEGFTNVLLKGQGEGLFRKNPNVGVLVAMNTYSMNMAMSEKLKFPNGTPPIEACKQSFVNMLRGEATSRGLEIIDTMVEKYNI